MIQIQCPRCALEYSAADEKAGKSDTCPNCSAQFVIPHSPATLTPSISPPAAVDVEIKPCPKCAARLSVSEMNLGQDVECPYCTAVYTARRAEERDEPRNRNRGPRYDDDPYEGDRPGRRQRRDYVPHRGGTILTLGILGIFCCGILAVVAAVMGTNDLAQMKRGTMDPEGRGMTQAGQIIGFIGIALMVLAVILNVLVVILGG